MIVLVIVGIMLGIGVPAMRELLMKSRMTSTLNDIVVGMQTARGEAVKNARSAVLCQSTAGTACDGASWADGWIVWVDHDGDTNVDAAGVDLDGDTVVDTEEIVALGISVDGVNFVADADATTADLFNDAQIVFRADGSSDIDPTKIRGVLVVCIDQSVSGVIEVELTGRPSAERHVTVAAECP